MSEEKKDALKANEKYLSSVEESIQYNERFDILETINNVGNDEVFTPVETVKKMLKILPEEVWHNPNYKWLNPCDKNGVFLREIARKLNDGLKDVPGYEDEEVRKKHILQDMLYSIGLTKFTSLVSRRTVYYCSTANKKSDGKFDNDGHSYNGFAIGNGQWFDTEEGNILSPITEHQFGRDGSCIFCGTKVNGRYNNLDQNEHYAYEFIHVHHLSLQKHLQDRFFKGDRKMKFDIIIGNPPYQLNFGIEGTNSSNSGAIYNKFISSAISLNPKYICMIVPSKWMTKTAQGIPESWVDEMLSSNKLRVIHDFQNANVCFPNQTRDEDISLKGGCNYFLWDRDYNGVCEYHYYPNLGGEYTRTGYLDPFDVQLLIRDPRVFAIIDNIVKKEGKYYGKTSDKSFYSLVSPKHFFDNSIKLTSNWRDYQTTRDEEHSIKYYVSENTNGIPYGWIREDDIPKHKEVVNMHKVFIPAAGSEGMEGKILGDPIYGEPGSVCSQTYLVIGYDEKKHNFSENQCKNIISYIRTRFFRFLVSVIKITQNGSRNIYQLVPVLDFSKSWTDDELFDRYRLSEDQKKYIKNYVKEM